MVKTRRLVTLLALMSFSGLGHAATPACHAIRDGEQPRTAALGALACQLKLHRLLLFGELHGTAESPDLLAALLRAQPAERPIRLGLEWPMELQSKVAAYFQSDGTAADRSAFAAGRDWTYFDGRMSQAWLSLLDSLRDLRRRGRDIQVFTMEPTYGTPTDVAAAGGFVEVKEAGIAKAISAQLHHAPPGVLVVALMGNYHTRVGSKQPDYHSSVTYRLAADHPMVLLPQSEHGTFWAIVSPQNRAAVHTINRSGPLLPKQDVVVKTERDVPADAIVKTILLPIFTASPHP
ncbi:MAG: hypothetical protein HOQ10_01200 [Frateuria sp.]|nr:hypothetical protein [Frateuria sp.]